MSPATSHSDAAGLARSYLAKPDAFGANPRQAAKLETALERLGEEMSLRGEQLHQRLIDCALQRCSFGPPTIYVQNMGSSGSHWFAGMLRNAFGFLSSGEIYFPNGLLREIDKFATDGVRPLPLQAAMLAHVMRRDADNESAYLVNTAHIANIDDYATYDIGAVRILLLRHPVDVVLSRTYRKQDYREYLGKTDIPDDEYTAQNIRYVKSFLTNTLPQSYDLVIRYEELLDAPMRTIEKVAELLDIPVTRSQIAAAVNNKSGEVASQKIFANKYGGEAANIPERLIQYICTELSDLSEAAGYGAFEAVR